MDVGETGGGRAGRVPVVALVGLGIATVAALAAGVFVLGRVTDSDRVAMALTAVWFGLVALGGLLLTRGRRPLLVSVSAGWVIAAAAVGVLVGLPTLTDRTVDQEVVVGTRQEATATAPAAAVPTDAAVPSEAAEAQAPPPAPVNVEVARGAFVPLAHPGEGAAAVVQLAEGGRVLTLTGFATDNGPDLRVYLTERDPAVDGDIGEFVDLGVLQGNRGDQQYEIPDDVDLARYPNAVVWCRAFAVGFTSAPLVATG